MVVTWIPSHIGIRVIAIMSMYKDVLIDYVEVTDILQSSLYEKYSVSCIQMTKDSICNKSFVQS